MMDPEDSQQHSGATQGPSTSVATPATVSQSGQGQSQDGDAEETSAVNIVNLFEDKREKEANKKEESPHGDNLNNQLEEFRQQWQDELQNRPDGQDANSFPLQRSFEGETTCHTNGEDDIEEQARGLFLRGMEAEDDGFLNEAIYYYKKALQLVPDIESKLGNIFTYSPRDKVRQDSVNSVDDSETEEDLLVHFENLRVDEKALCQPLYEKRVTHISALPVELVTYILQWVVSPDLDLKSLEMFSSVCRGFFMCVRDERLWKMACLRIWGINLGSSKKYGGSWRRMMIERPHVLYSGCYISRMSYIRQGEQSLDQFYRPYHMVEYYRYARFFPDGVVLMLVSPEEPTQSLPRLRYRHSKSSGLLRGGYKISDTKVTCVLKRVKTEQNQVYRYKRQRRAAMQNEMESTYYAEFEISNAKWRQNAQLTWLKYSICTVYKATGEESTSNFDLHKRSFPPLIYSHVKSYTTNTTEPLT